MFSRSKRIFGMAAMTLIAGAVLATPAHADDVDVTGLGILRALHSQLCLPSMTTGIQIVDTVLPQLAGCGDAGLSD
jgi:hypothetical protein